MADPSSNRNLIARPEFEAFQQRVTQDIAGLASAIKEESSSRSRDTEIIRADIKSLSGNVDRPQYQALGFAFGIFSFVCIAIGSVFMWGQESRWDSVLEIKETLDGHMQEEGHSPTTIRLSALEKNVLKLDTVLQREMRLLDGALQREMRMLLDAPLERIAAIESRLDKIEAQLLLVNSSRWSRADHRIEVAPLLQKFDDEIKDIKTILADRGNSVDRIEAEQTRRTQKVYSEKDQ